jgi:hypothetical protein
VLDAAADLDGVHLAQDYITLFHAVSPCRIMGCAAGQATVTSASGGQQAQEARIVEDFCLGTFPQLASCWGFCTDVVNGGSVAIASPVAAD